MAQHTISVDVESLIKVLATALYSNSDVFLREMIQNALDACVKRRLTGQGSEVPEPLIRVIPNEAKSTISIEDNGAGMTEQEIHDYLAKIGASDKQLLRAKIAECDLAATESIVGQFGIGLLSAFLVANKLEIVTKTPGGAAWCWTSHGGSSYALEPATKSSVGTTVTLYLASGQQRYLQTSALREIITRYSDFIGIAICLGQSGEAINAIDAPWHRDYPNDRERRDAHYIFWERRFRNEQSLAVLPLDSTFSYQDLTTGETRTGRVRGILGVTDRNNPIIDRGGTLDIYINRVFVADANRDTLPQWASFIQGVIECNDLTPNAARDNIQHNYVASALRSCLGLTIIQWLQQLAVDNITQFRDIMTWHSFQILAMCAEEANEAFYRAIANLVPLPSDQGNISMEEYFTQAGTLPDGKKSVYYISESASESQFYMLCQARKLRVFNAARGYVRPFLEKYEKLWPNRIHLTRIDVADSVTIFAPIEQHERAEFESLETYANALKCTAKVSHFLPKEVPALLSHSRENSNRDELTITAEHPGLPPKIRATIKIFLDTHAEPLTLHLNADNGIVRQLARRLKEGDDIAKQAMLSLYNNAIMLNSRNITPENIRIMFDQYNRVIGDLLETADRIDELEVHRQQLLAQLDENARATGSPQLDRWVTCFVAMPFGHAITEKVYRALERVLEDVPFLWNVLRADESVEEARLWSNVGSKMARAHCFIADVSDWNPNVMIEVGRMEAFNRPLLLLKRKGSEDLPADLRERLYVEYDSNHNDLASHLREEISKQNIFRQQKGMQYLSPILLQSRASLSETLSRALATQYPTCEEFLGAQAKEVAEKNSVRVGLIQAAQEAVSDAISKLR